MSGRDQGHAAPGDSDARDVAEWKRIECSPEFARLVAARRRVIVPSLIVFVLVFGSFVVLAAWAREFMAREILSGFTIAYAFALGLIVMTWLLALIYIRASNSRIDPLAEAVVSLVAGGEQPAAPERQRQGPPPGGQGAR